MSRHIYRMTPNLWAVVDTSHPEGHAKRITWHKSAESAQEQMRERNY